MKHHFEITQYLRTLSKQHLMDLGGALGLFYCSLRDMDPLRGEMVHAWLNMQDNVTKKPSWHNLVIALRKIDNHGIADTIAKSMSHE